MTTLPQCPEDYNLLIREKRKCIDNCQKDSIYKYQYNGECYVKCPKDTNEDNIDHICKVINIESCTMSSSQFELNDFLKEGGVEKIAKTYAKEFNYTTKHISLLKNEVYSIMLYKDKDCINELGLSMPEIDFGECYEKVQYEYKLENKDLIVAIIDKKSKKKNNPITSYIFYNPESGDKLDAEEICKEKIIIVKENIKSLLNESVSDIDSILYLTNQNINVFNKSSEFYNDLCYHFDSPCNKDVALKDRLLIYYPNITLCDSGCTNVGVNLTAMTAICECKYKDYTEDDSDDEDNIYKDVVNQVNNILNQVNLAVMGCYKDLFEYDFFISNTGGIILLILIIIKIITLIIYYKSSLFLINKYIYNVAHNYLLYLNRSPFANTNFFDFKDNNNKKIDNEKNEENKNCPIKKKSLVNNDNNKQKIDHNNDQKKISNKKLKGIIIKTQENTNNENKLSSELIKKSKKLTQNIRLYSSKKLKKNDLSLKSNDSSIMDKSKVN